MFETIGVLTGLLFLLHAFIEHPFLIAIDIFIIFIIIYVIFIEIYKRNIQTNITNNILKANTKELLLKELNRIKEIYFKNSSNRDKYINLEKINDKLFISIVLKLFNGDFLKIDIETKYKEEYENYIFPIFDLVNFYFPINNIIETPVERMTRVLKIYLYYFFSNVNSINYIDKNFNLKSNIKNDFYNQNDLDFSFFIDEVIDDLLRTEEQKLKLLKINDEKESNILAEELIDILLMDTSNVDYYFLGILDTWNEIKNNKNKKIKK